MLKKRIKKAFTLVELVVVIAIIAILAGVSVAVYIGVTNKAKTAADSEIISQLNTQMRAKSITDGHNKTAYDAYLDAREIGFDLELMKPQTGGKYVWDETNDLFACVEIKNNNFGDIVAEDKTSSFSGKGWVFTNTIDENALYGQYLNEVGTQETVNVVAGFDAGKNINVKTVNYVRTSGDSQEVIIRTNSVSTNIGIKAPNDDVYFFGQAGKICGINNDGRLDESIGAVVANSSLHIDEKTKVTYIKIAQGHIENKGAIDLIYATTENVAVTNTGYIDHAHGSKSVADSINTALDSNSNKKTTGVTFDYNENKEQNGCSDVYHHVSEGTPVEGNKPVTGTEAWNGNNIESTISSTVDQITGLVLTVQYNNKTEKMGLSDFRDRWNDGEFFDTFTSATLTTNADISEIDWYPIGNWKYPFYGTFNGNGNTISGLTARSIDKDHEGLYSNGDTIGFGETYGLFGIIAGGDLTINNLNLTDVEINIYNGKNVGALVGYVPNNEDFTKNGKGGQYWANTQTSGKKIVPENFGKGNINISNVSVSGTIFAESHIGGLVGKIYSAGTATFDRCVNNLTITEVGLGGLAGIVGYCNGNEAIIVKNCKNLEDAKLIFNPSSSSSGVMLSDFAYLTNPSKLTCDDTNINQATVVLPTENTKKNISQFTYSGKAPITLEGYTIGTVNSVSTLTLKNCKVTGKTTNTGNMTIEGCTIDYLNNQGTITIESGTFCTKNAFSDGTTCVVKNSGTMTINGGTFNKDVINNEGATIIVKGGNFKINPSSNYLAEGYISKLQNGVYIVEQGDWSAVYSGKKYATLQEAVNAFISSSGKIQLLTDIETSETITCGKPLVFDLNGHNLDCAITTNGNFVNFYGNGTVTLKSGTNVSKVYTREQANVVIETGAVVNRGTGDAVQIEAGTGTITIKGGTITGNVNSKNSPNGKIIIEGGTIKGTVKVEAGTGTITIKGGTIDAMFSANNGKIIIQGGTFTSDPTPYLAEGYKAEKQGDKWVVSKNN